MGENRDYRRPPPKVEKILREHQNWRETGKGERANFSDWNLEKINFAGRDLRQVMFHQTILRGASFQKAYLDDAELQEADLQEADLSQAILRNVDLTTAKHLLVAQLAGADLTGATVPKQIQDFLDKPGNLDEVGRLSGALFVTLLSACAYIGLTVLSTSDAGLLTNMATSKLPILSIDIPIAWFYWLAPFLLLSMYMYFHLTLQRFWDNLAALPAKYPDGRRLDQVSYPWLLNALVGEYNPQLQDRRQVSLRRLQVYISIFFAWWVVPLMIAVLWFRYLTRHDEFWTWMHIIFLGVAIWFGFYSWRAAKSALQGQRGFLLALGRNLFSGIMAVCLLLITFLLPIISYGVIRGIPADQNTDENRISAKTQEYLNNPTANLWNKVWWISTDSNPGLCSKWYRIFPLVCQNLFSYNPFADLSNMDVSIKPAKWTGDISQESSAEKEVNGQDKESSLSAPQEPGKDKKTTGPPPEEIALVKGAPLHEQNLRYVKAKRAFIVKGEFQNKRGPDFQGADLQGAYLPEADLRKANLEKAILDRALMNNANFSEAFLHNASLRKVASAEADFTNANLQGANLSEANLEGANFVGAKFQGADFSGALLQGADFRGAQGLEVNQLKKKARLWILAKYGQDMAIKMGLPGDHCDRLKNKDLSGYHFQGLNLAKANLAYMHLEWAKFQGANLSEANLTGAKLRNANLKGAILTRAELREADFQGVLGLLAARVKEGKTWVLAQYDPVLREKLGLPADHNGGVNEPVMNRNSKYMKDLSGYPWDKIDLAEADLSQINLEKAKLTGKNLTKVNFTGANLSKVDFTNAILTGAKFSEADLQGARFKNNKDLDDMELKKAKFWLFAYYDDLILKKLDLPLDHNDKLKLRDFRHLHNKLVRTNLAGVDFSKANLKRVNLQGADLKEANLQEAHLENAHVEGANLTWADLKKAYLEGTYLVKGEPKEDKGLQKEQARIVQGARNWFLGHYDDVMRKSLGLPENHNQWLERNDLSRYDFAQKYLYRGDFSNLNLEEASFQDSYLSKGDFTGAKLNQANLTRAYLGCAKFSRANLSEAKLYQANLKESDFRKAKGLVKAQVLEAKNWVLARYDDKLREDLGLPADHNKRIEKEKKDLSHYNFDGKHLNNYLEESDFSGVYLGGAKFVGCSLKKVDFSQAHLEKAELSRTECQEANLEGAFLSGAKFIRAKLNNADLRGADLSGADLSKADLTKACLEKVNLKGAKLHGAILEKTDLRGADLMGVQGLSQEQRKVAIIDPITKMP